MLQLFDLAGIYFRAFHALPTSLTSPDGCPVNAVRGTLDILARVIDDARPTRAIACLDLDWRPAWRVELVPSYKAHRVDQQVEPPTVDGISPEEIPDELGPQVPILLKTLAAIGISIAGAVGFEADDVIGTLARQEREDPVEVVTGDRDLYQLADDEAPTIRVRYIGAGMSKVAVLSAADVAAKHSIPIGGYADFAALRGDPSDGLPGVAGIGDKTAAILVSTYGSIEAMTAAAADPRSGMKAPIRTKLLAAADYLAVAPIVVNVASDAPVHVEPAGNGLLHRDPVDPGGLAHLIRQQGIGASVARLLKVLREL